jgi:hypothetical protein
MIVARLKPLPIFEGMTVRQIESTLIARRVDRLTNQALDRPEAEARAEKLRDALTLKPRKLKGTA